MTMPIPSPLRRIARVGETVAASIFIRLAAAVLLLAVAVTTQAQQERPTERVYRVGHLSPNFHVPEIHDAFVQALRDLGYVEGQNLIIESRFAEGKVERLPELVSELVRLKVDVIVSGSTVSVLAAKKATTTIPIVFASVFDPVGSGIVKSLARPEGNVTGISIGVSGAGLGGKWVQLLKDTAPRIAHIAVLWNSANASSTVYVREAQSAARKLNVKIDVLDAGTPGNLERALVAIAASPVQGIIVTPDPFFHANQAELVRFAASKRLPAIYFSTRFVDGGGLMSYGASFEGSWRKAAAYVDKILKGTKPADLPVEQPTKFELMVNMKAARALGLTIPQVVLRQADRVIE